MDEPRFLAGNKCALPVGERDENRRRCKIEVGSVGFGAVDGVRRAARGVPSIRRRQLPRPAHFPGREIERHERIAGVRGRIAVVVSGRDVHGITADVNRGLVQIGAPEGPHNCVPERFFFLGKDSSAIMYVFQICLPSAGVQRDQAAAKAATLVVGSGGGALFARSHADVEPAVVKRRRARDSGRREVIHLRCPQKRSSRGIDGVNAAGSVANESRAPPA